MGTYEDWVGREERVSDIATAAPAHLMAATLDRENLAFRTGEVLPPVWHWLYFLDAVRTHEVGTDGHPPRGAFLPPVTLPRRMRAGGQFKIERPIRIGEELQRRSRITGISEKMGASGPLVFVLVEHEIRANGAVAVVEEESIAYRGAATPAAGPSARTSTPITVSMQGETRFATNPVLLFRFSAVTFNSHRIHYDTDYARGEESYAERVVQGPLVALLILEHLHKKHSPLKLRHFQYRAVAPSFCGEVICVSNTPLDEHGRTRVLARNGVGADAIVGDAMYAD